MSSNVIITFTFETDVNINICIGKIHVVIQMNMIGHSVFCYVYVV